MTAPAPSHDPHPMDQPLPGATIPALTDWHHTLPAAVELSGTIRMAVGGMSAEQIATVTGMDRATLAARQQAGLDQQRVAERWGLPVHGGHGLHATPDA